MVAIPKGGQLASKGGRMPPPAPPKRNPVVYMHDSAVVQGGREGAPVVYTERVCE